MKNRYKLVKLIKSGGMGIVELAVNLENNTQCVVKYPIYSGEREDAMRVEKLRNEALILSSCSHPNIVKYIDSFEEGGIFYLVMEYIDGLSLGKLSKGKWLGEERVVKWCKQILSGLSHLHHQNIIYRDLKPENVMVRRSDDSAVLIDFGGAKKGAIETMIRATGSIFTPIYAAPEQIIENRTDVRSDIFSMGATMYYMLTGMDPERPRSIDGIPSPAPLNPEVNEHLVYIVMKASALDPTQRFQSAEEMLSMFDYIPSPVQPKIPKIVLLREFRSLNGTKEFLLQQQVTTIGRYETRGQKPTIAVMDKFVSLGHKKGSIGHARIIKENNNYWIEDLSSTNGTFVNGVRIDGKVLLKNRDRIRLGPFTLFEFRI